MRIVAEGVFLIGGAFVAALAVATSLTPLVRDYATRRRLLDHGLTSRKLHGRPVPRLGGVAIVIAFFTTLSGVIALGRVAWQPELRFVIAIVLGGLAIAALGAYDDLRGADARTKFAVQFGVAALAWWLGCRIDVVTLPFAGAFDLGALSLPVTLLWIAGVTNAMNLVDGVDGLAGSVALVVLLAFAAMAPGGRPVVVLAAATLAGAAAGFLFFNAHPASIFMGDTGSMFIGFVVAVVSLQATRASSASALPLVVPVLALGYPIGDTLLAMARRVARGLPPFCADRGHIHHRLLARGFTPGQTTAILCGVSLVLCVAAALVWRESGPAALVLLAGLGMCGVAALRWLGFVDATSLRNVAAARQRNVERRREVAKLASLLRGAADPYAICLLVADVGRVLKVDYVSLTAMGRVWTFTPPASEIRHVVRYSLQRASRFEGALEIGWAAGEPLAHRETEIAVERLCPHIGAALRRVGRPVEYLPLGGRQVATGT